MATNNPFKPAVKQNKRIKMLFYGSAGTGKTTTALKLGKLAGGKVALIDMEGGADLYADAEGIPAFDVLRTKNYQDVMNALDFIEKARHEYSLLILDPITVLWNVIIEAFQVIRGDKGLTHADWGIIKRKVYAIYNRLVNLPLHVIVIARAKDEYEGKDDNRRKVGENPDAEKSIEYLFDVVLNIRVAGDTRFADVGKDRSNALGKRVTDLSPESFKALFGAMPSGGDDYHQESEADAAAKIVQEIEAENAQPAKAKGSRRLLDTAHGEKSKGEPSGSNGNGHTKIERPMSAAQVIDALQRKAITNDKPADKVVISSGQARALAIRMGEYMDDFTRKYLLKQTFKVDTSKELTNGEMSALMQWLPPASESSDTVRAHIESEVAALATERMATEQAAPTAEG